MITVDVVRTLSYDRDRYVSYELQLDCVGAYGLTNCVLWESAVYNSHLRYDLYLDYTNRRGLFRYTSLRSPFHPIITTPTKKRQQPAYNQTGDIEPNNRTETSFLNHAFTTKTLTQPGHANYRNRHSGPSVRPVQLRRALDECPGCIIRIQAPPHRSSISDSRYFQGNRSSNTGEIKDGCR